MFSRFLILCLAVAAAALSGCAAMEKGGGPFDTVFPKGGIATTAIPREVKDLIYSEPLEVVDQDGNTVLSFRFREEGSWLRAAILQCSLSRCRDRYLSIDDISEQGGIGMHFFDVKDRRVVLLFPRVWDNNPLGSKTVKKWKSEYGFQYPWSGSPSFYYVRDGEDKSEVYLRPKPLLQSTTTVPPKEEPTYTIEARGR